MENKTTSKQGRIKLINQKLTFNRGYVGIHTTAFKDFLLKQELMKAISTCGFEHPSEGKETY